MRKGETLSDLLVPERAESTSLIEAHQSHVALMERLMIQAPQIDCPVRHYFSPGIFAREMTIPAGTIISGAVHKTDNMIIISMGRLRISAPEGPIEASAGDTFICHAGAKNLVVTLEDSRWTNLFHNPTNETDIDKLIEMVSESKACELMGEVGNKQLLSNQATEQLGNKKCHLE